MSSHSCLAKEFHWGCVEFILKAKTPKLLFLRSTGEFYPIDWWSHDKSMCEVFTIWGVCVDNVVRVYGWSLGKGQNILAKRLKIDFLGALCKILVRNFVYSLPISKLIFHLKPQRGSSEKKVSWEPHSACIICSELPCTMAYRAAISTCFTALC